VTERRERRLKRLLDDLKEKKMILEIEGGSTRSHCVEKSLWKKLCMTSETDYGISEVQFLVLYQ
jgi:hypothetical protein